MDNANNAQAAWIGSDNRIRARYIPFGAPPEATRVLSPAGGTLTRDPVSVTDPAGVGTTMWLDSSSGTQQLYVTPAGGGSPEGPSPPIRPTRMVAFGDSYSSGEGLTAEGGLDYDCGTDMHEGMYRQDTTVLAERSWSSLDCDTRTLSRTQPADLYQRPFRKHANLCHRQARAYPNQIRSGLGVQPSNYMFVACSGAVTRNIGLLTTPAPRAQYPSSPVNVRGGQTQMATVDPAFTQNGEPDLVTIGIGGNDAGFAEIIEQCLRDDCLDPVFQDGAMAKIEGTAFHHVRDTFVKLRKRFPDATVLAFGYPEVVGDLDKPCGPVGILGWNASHDELDWIKTEVEPTLNRTIKDAAASAGVVYVDIEAATRGHELCSDTDDRWINGFVDGDDIDLGFGIWKGSESFHPNQKGHDAIARYFVDRYTNGAERLTVQNPDPSSPPRPAPRPEIYLGSLEASAVRSCGDDCHQSVRCEPGCSIHLEGDGFVPGSRLTVTLHSEPVVLGTIQVDGEGQIAGDFATPLDTPAGVHVLKLTGTSDGRHQYGGAFLKVFEIGSPPPGGAPILPRLPATPKRPPGRPSAPTPAITRRITSSVTARWRRDGRATRVASLVVRRVSRGSTIKVACKRPTRTPRSSGCGFVTKRFKMTSARQRLRLTRLFRRPMAAGTRITISITHPAWIGKRVVFVLRRAGTPKTTHLCLPVGSSVSRRKC